jgi:trehalose synthase
MATHSPIVHVPIAPVPPGRFMAVLSAEQAQQFERTIARGQALLGRRVVWNVNSTARGGGVAEMLASLLAYTRGAGLDARWVVIRGDADFFRVTKRIHNMLHGWPGDGLGLEGDARGIYEQTASANAWELERLMRAGDLVLLHDPQTAGLIGPLRKLGARVVWRCHIGIDEPNEEARAAWRFLLPYVREAEAVVFSRDAFIWEGIDLGRVCVIPPSIDAFSAKNQEMTPANVSAVLRASGLEPGRPAGDGAFVREDGTPGRVDRRAELSGSRPLPADVPALVQVSRWDRLKDPLGVLRAFGDGIAAVGDAHLALAGPSVAAVSDDPEGAQVLADVVAFRAGLRDDVRERVHLFSLPMDDIEENAAIVNALQRRAQVVAQKSLAEGFGLTVAEAMWKARPVVASRVGGIREQIADGDTGVLVEPRDLPAFARACARLLADSAGAEEMGKRAREAVRKLYLGPRHLRQYVDLFERLLATPAP